MIPLLLYSTVDHVTLGLYTDCKLRQTRLSFFILRYTFETFLEAPTASLGLRLVPLRSHSLRNISLRTFR